MAPELLVVGDGALDAAEREALVSGAAEVALVGLLPVPEQPVCGAVGVVAGLVAQCPADEVVVGGGVDRELEGDGHAVRRQGGDVDGGVGVDGLSDGRAVGRQRPARAAVRAVVERLREAELEARLHAVPAGLLGAGAVAAVTGGGVAVVAGLAGVEGAVAAGRSPGRRGEGNAAGQEQEGPQGGLRGGRVAEGRDVRHGRPLAGCRGAPSHPGYPLSLRKPRLSGPPGEEEGSLRSWPRCTGRCSVATSSASPPRTSGSPGPPAPGSPPASSPAEPRPGSS